MYNSRKNSSNAASIVVVVIFVILLGFTIMRSCSNQSITKNFDAVYDAQKGGVYGIIFSDTGERRLIKFQPPENLIDAIKKYNPRCVFKA